MTPTSPSEFLAAFYPDKLEDVRLRLFKAKKAPDSQHNRPIKYATTRAELTCDVEQQAKLKQANRTRGVYFVVNAGSDEDDGIGRFNACFAESDEHTLEEQHARLDNAPLAPSIRVETLKSVHAYWLLSGDCGEAEWRDMQAHLIAHFGGDEKIKNPSRVMRLPFFNHVHYNPEDGTYSYKHVELTAFNPARRYTIQEMRTAFPEVEPEAQARHTSEAPPSNSSEATNFASWDELHSEAARRIRTSTNARTDRKGWMQAPGICHGSSDGKAMYVSPDGAYGCHKGCPTASIRLSLGLPERPSNTTTGEEQATSVQSKEEAPALR
ncbi:MAG: RepB family DNA primase, partial [Acidobacteriota bacterium]|nr:RepB family DNA primase [Acidobacteriota bacterium]